MSRTIAVANQKGGVAKTTTVASLGAALAELGQRVLARRPRPAGLPDLLPRRGSGGPATVRAPGAARQGVPAQASSSRATTASTCCRRRSTWRPPRRCCSAGPEREHVLRRALAAVVDGYDWVLLDCSPSLGVLTVNGLTAADEVLMPMQCETLSHRGVGQLVETVKDVQRHHQSAAADRRGDPDAVRRAGGARRARARRHRRPVRAAGARAPDRAVGAVRRGARRRAVGAGDRQRGASGAAGYREHAARMVRERAEPVAG